MSLFFFFFLKPKFSTQNTAGTRKWFKVCHVFKQCKHNSILRSVESTLNPNQTKTTQEHDTKSHSAAKPTTTRREFLSPACSFAPSSLLKGGSHATALPDQTPWVGKRSLYGSVWGTSEIISWGGGVVVVVVEGGRIKIKAISHIVHLSEPLPPHRSRLPV